MKVLRVAAGLVMSAALTVLSSCYPFMGALPPGAAQEPTIQHVPYSGTFSYTVNAGSTPKDVYFVFTNPSTTKDVSGSPAFAGASIAVDGKSLPSPVTQALPNLVSAPQTVNERVAEFNRDPWAHLQSGSALQGPSGNVASRPAENDIDDGTLSDTFRLLVDPAVGMVDVVATCRRVRSIVDSRDGLTHTVSIWVANANWGSITQGMVDAVADKFMKASGSDDIYHWDTDVVGQPWGPHGYTDLIAWDPKRTITILMADLNPNYTGPTITVGYFWGKDNITTAFQPDSNQRIMFYLDASLYTMTETVDTMPPGDSSNYWPKVEFSTLAHEFQHMIQFYQKLVLYGLSSGAEVWINEMCSMIMEDLVADKLNVEGPRGVPLVTLPGPVLTSDPTAGSPGITDGRIHEFNGSSYFPLVVTSKYEKTEYYAVAYAFGAWLARNYGGAELLRRIVQCPQTDESAVVNAVIKATGNPNESLTTLLERWAASVLLSDSTTAPTGYRYNTGGWFTSSLAGESYNLGSIDFFNYTPSLTIYTPSSPAYGPTNHSSNIYYEAAASLTGSRTWNITVPPGILMNVVIR